MYFIWSFRTLLLIGQNVSNMDHNSFMIYVRQLVDILQIFFFKSDNQLIWIEISKLNFDRWSWRSIGFQNIFTYLLRVDNLEVPCSNMHVSHWSLYLTYPCRKAVRFKVLFWWQHRWQITRKINFLNTPKREIVFLSTFITPPKKDPRSLLMIQWIDTSYLRTW